MSVLNIEFIKEEVRPERADGLTAIHFSGFNRETGNPQYSGFLFKDEDLRDSRLIDRLGEFMRHVYGPKPRP
jgi:hypothetical protein